MAVYSANGAAAHWLARTLEAPVHHPPSAHLPPHLRPLHPRNLQHPPLCPRQAWTRPRPPRQTRLQHLASPRPARSTHATSQATSASMLSCATLLSARTLLVLSPTPCSARDAGTGYSSVKASDIGGTIGLDICKGNIEIEMRECCVIQEFDLGLMRWTSRQTNYAILRAGVAAAALAPPDIDPLADAAMQAYPQSILAQSVPGKGSPAPTGTPAGVVAVKNDGKRCVFVLHVPRIPPSYTVSFSCSPSSAASLLAHQTPLVNFFTSPHLCLIIHLHALLSRLARILSRADAFNSVQPHPSAAEVRTATRTN